MEKITRDISVRPYVLIGSFFNTVKERNLNGVSGKQVQAFLDTLEKRHISATRRREMGDDIEGACGQLRKKVLEEGKK